MTTKIAKFQFPPGVGRHSFFKENHWGICVLSADDVNGTPVVMLDGVFDSFGNAKEHLVLFGNKKIWVTDRYLEFE